MKKLVAALAALVVPALVAAQDYPSKPVHMLVAFPPGGPTDIIARLLSEQLARQLGQPVVVENKVGASGNIATQEVAKSAPDGYTTLIHSSAYAVNPTLFGNAGYDPAKDLTAVAVVAQQANIILVNSSFPAKTLAELKSAMQKGKLAFASPGTSAGPFPPGSARSARRRIVPSSPSPGMPASGTTSARSRPRCVGTSPR
jgi:tripartite-type tricarboxylate transporter receptor subunit TctC